MSTLRGQPNREPHSRAWIALFALYSHPELVANSSPELVCRLRGPTSFRFSTLHAALVAELAELTHACYEQFVADGVL